MSETPPAQGGRPRPWLIDAAFGAALALGLITAAEAALPQVGRLAPSPRPAAAAKPPPAARPAAHPVLIAFREPLAGYRIISPFGLRQLPWEEGGRLHAGVDIAAPAGLQVAAAADGVVTRVATDAGYGRLVELKHAAGLTTRYAHLSRFLPQIAPGVAVKAGSPVGEIGSTGTSTGAHLHFEIRDDQDRPLNPELFLGRSFATSGDLPLRAALRVPHGVRVAFVSNIPRTKRVQMQARLASDAADDAAMAEPTELAANAPANGADATAEPPGVALRERPHARFVLSN